MSDLSNEITIAEEMFDASDYMRALCTNTKITIPKFINYEFQSGWKNVIEDFVNVIKDYSISIIHMTDTFSQLDITFEAMGEENELFVWRAIEDVRQISRSICACCGNLKQDWKRRGSVKLRCKVCEENSTKNGSTGTWLDKY